MIVILPIPRMSRETTRWDRVMPQPLHLLPGGIRDLACCALENQTNFDSFLEDVLVLMEEHANDDLDYPLSRRIARLMKRQEYMFIFENLLQIFYDDFLQMVLPILGSDRLYPQRVISYHPINGICVEMSHEPSSRFAYCQAR